VPEGPDATPTADAAELVLRLVEETARRQRAEARAEAATATAEAETARAALVDLRATAVQSIASVRARDGSDRIAAMHQGLLALRADLDGLRAAAEAAFAGPALAGDPGLAESPAPGRPVDALAASGETRTAAGEPAPETAASPGGSSATASSPTGPDLARSARELLARGRLDVADEVIRGLEDAAARLRAQVPPPTDD
jgi:hypothetical protein